MLSTERVTAFQKAVHELYSWEDVLREQGISEFKQTADGFNCKCPFHADKRPSFFVHKNTNSFYCYSCHAVGGIGKLLFNLQDADTNEFAFYDHILKANKYLQDSLGFNTLFIDSKTLSPEFEKRRVFSASSHLQQDMPIGVLTDRLKDMDDSWEMLAFSLSLLQSDIRTDDVYRLAKRKSKEQEEIKESAVEEKTSLNSLLLGE